MPKVNGIYYRLGRQRRSALLVLVHSLGADHTLWDAQVPMLLPRFQVLRVGPCEVTARPTRPAGEYTMDELAADVRAVIDAVGRREFLYCGLSIGGMIGMVVAANMSAGLTKLVLADTSSKFDGSLFETRRRTALNEGMAPIAATALERSFTPKTIKRRVPYVASFLHNLMSVNTVGYAGCCAALRDADCAALLERIQVPTLVITGDADISTPFQGHGDVLVNNIAGAQSVIIAGGAHLSNVDRPSAFLGALFNFLDAGTSRRLDRAAARPRRQVSGRRGGCDHAVYARLSRNDYQIRMGRNLGTSRTRPAHAPHAGAGPDRVARKLGGVPRAPPHRAGTGNGDGRREGSAPASGHLWRASHSRTRLQSRGRGGGHDKMKG